MLKIKKLEEGNNIIFNLEGKLDTNTAPELEAEIGKCNTDFKDMIFDFEKLDTLSSAGLRLLLNTHQDLNEGQRLILKNVSELVMDIFEITGFSDILNIENCPSSPWFEKTK